MLRFEMFFRVEIAAINHNDVDSNALVRDEDNLDDKPADVEPDVAKNMVMDVESERRHSDHDDENVKAEVYAVEDDERGQVTFVVRVNSVEERKVTGQADEKRKQNIDQFNRIDEIVASVFIEATMEEAEDNTVANCNDKSNQTDDQGAKD